jgi:hypothetical protein
MIDVPPPTRISNPRAVADPRDEGDVVDARDRAVLVRAVKAVLTLRGMSCVVGGGRSSARTRPA